MPAHLLGMVRNVFVYDSNASNANLFTKAGSPTVPGNFVFIVNAGVTILGTSYTGRALQVPAFPTGSTLLLIVRGSIIGAGGIGGGGGLGIGGGQPVGRGGNAIELQHALTIDASQGLIGGGGSGGAGGAGARVLIDLFWTDIAGGGGGGGQGGGSCDGGPGYEYGTAGSASAPGNGGAGDPRGADPGDAGCTLGNYASGIAQAYAVKRNGYALTWIGDHSSTHVKGKVA